MTPAELAALRADKAVAVLEAELADVTAERDRLRAIVDGMGCGEIKAERARLAAQLDWAGPMLSALNERHTELVLENDRLAVLLRETRMWVPNDSSAAGLRMRIDAALQGTP